MTRAGWHEEDKQMAGNVCRRLKPNIIIEDNEFKMDYSNVVPFDVKQRCFLEADGFGPMSLREIEDTEYDWSHVRDSTLEAFIRMNEVIKAYDESVSMHGPHNINWWNVANERLAEIRQSGF